jgi:hypothetical protein
MKSQNDLLLYKLKKFYSNNENLEKMLEIINGKEERISLRIVDWFSTNYAKKYFTIYSTEINNRFKVYDDYKLKLKAYSKKRFDPFCRWERIKMPINEDYSIETTIGQLNFFKWAIENKIIEYIEENYDIILKDMNANNSISRNKKHNNSVQSVNVSRKRREELSISASKCFKKEKVDVILSFNIGPNANESNINSLLYTPPITNSINTNI